MRLNEGIFLVWSSLFIAKRTSMFRTEKGRLLFKWQGQEGIYVVSSSSLLPVPAFSMLKILVKVWAVHVPRRGGVSAPHGPRLSD